MIDKTSSNTNTNRQNKYDEPQHNNGQRVRHNTNGGQKVCFERKKSVAAKERPTLELTTCRQLSPNWR